MEPFPTNTLAELQNKRPIAAAPPAQPDAAELEAQLPLQSIRQKLRFSNLDVSCSEQQQQQQQQQKSSASVPIPDRMKVYLRVRPLNKAELLAGEEKRCFTVDGPKSIVASAPLDAPAAGAAGGGNVNPRDSERASHRFAFTRVFSESVSQAQMYDGTVAELVRQLVDGHSGLVFSYGVTSAGKTHTIQGSSDQPGILPRALKSLFASIGDRLTPGQLLRPASFNQADRLSHSEAQAALREAEILLKSDETSGTLATAWCNNSDVSIDSQSSLSTAGDSVTMDTSQSSLLSDQKRFCVWLSYAEIYNEVVYDLLEPISQRGGRKPTRTALDIRSDRNGAFYIKGLRCVPVSNARDACRLVLLGKQNQQVASTKLNQQSSRSHSLFAIRLVSFLDREAPNFGLVSSLTFCDLAGSERQRSIHGPSSSMPAAGNDRVREAGSINASLLTLRRCIETLQYNQQNPKSARLVPFRESKLTRLIQPYFSGSGRATMIVNISRCASLYDETLNVLKFSALASSITVIAPTPQRLMLAAPDASSPGIGIRTVAGATKTTSAAATTAISSMKANHNTTVFVPVYQTKIVTATVVNNSINKQRVQIVDPVAKETVANEDNENQHSVVEERAEADEMLQDQEQEEDVEEEEEEEEEDEQQYEVTYVDENEYEMAEIACYSKEDLIKLVAELRQSAQQMDEEMEERELRIRRELIAERDKLMTEMEDRFEFQLQEQKERQEELHEARLREYLNTSQSISHIREKRIVEAHNRQLENLRNRIAALEESLGDTRSLLAQSDEQLSNMTIQRDNLQLELDATKRLQSEQSQTNREEIEAEVNIRVKRHIQLQRRIAESADIRTLQQPAQPHHRSAAMRATLVNNDSFLLHELQAELDEEHENRERQVGAMTATLACSQEMLDGLRQERNMLAKELEMARLALREQSEKKVPDEVEASEAKDAKIAELEEQILQLTSQAETQIQQLEEQLEIELTESMAKDNKIRSIEDRLTQLESECLQKVESTEKLREIADQKLQTLAAESASKDQQLIELQNRLDSQVSELDEVINQLKQQLALEVASNTLKEQQLAELKQQIDLLNADESSKLTEMSDKLHQAEAKAELISQQLIDKDNLVAELTQRLQTVESEAQETVELLKQQLSSEQANVQQKEQRLAELTRQIESLDNQETERLKELTDKLGEAEAKLELLVAEAAAKEEKVAELMSKLDCELRNSDELSENLRRMETKFESVFAESSDKDQQVAELRTQLASSVSNSEERLKNLQQELARALETANRQEAAASHLQDQLAKESAEAEEKLADLKRQLANALEAANSNETIASSLKDQLARETAQSDEKFQALQQQLAEAWETANSNRALASDLKDQLAKESAESEEQLRVLQQQSDSHCESNNKLLVELASVRQQVAELEKQLSESAGLLAAEREKSTQRVKELSELKCHLDKQAAVAKTEAKSLQKDLADLREQLDRERVETAKKLHSLEQQLDLERNESIEKDKLLVDLKRQLSSAQAADHESEERMGLLEQQLAADTETIQSKNKLIDELRDRLALEASEAKKRLQSSEERTAAAEANLELANKDRDELRRQVGQLRADLDEELAAHRHRLEECRLASRQELEAARLAAEGELAKKQRELDDEMAKVAQLQVDKASLEDQLKAAEAKNEQLKLPPPPPPPQQPPSTRTSTRQTSMGSVRIGTKRQRLLRASIFSSDEDPDQVDEFSGDEGDDGSAAEELPTAAKRKPAPRRAAVTASAKNRPASKAKRARKSIVSTKARRGRGTGVGASAMTTPIMSSEFGSTRQLRSRTAANYTSDRSSVAPSLASSPTSLASAGQQQQQAEQAPPAPATEPKKSVKKSSIRPRLFIESVGTNSPLPEPDEDTGVTPPPPLASMPLLARAVSRVPAAPNYDLARLTGAGGGGRGGRRKTKK